MPFSEKKLSRTGFSSRSTADEVTEGIDATGLTAFVTGGTRGIGKETVRTLVKRGAHVYIGARNVERAGKVKEEILEENPKGKVDIIKLDISDLGSVRTAAEEISALNRPLNILVNNAGIMFVPFQKSKDGIELTFATNYLGHYFLTSLLLDKMKDTAKKTGIDGRIINVSSRGHNFFGYPGGIRFDQLNEEEGYSPYKAYGQSKLAQVLTTMELSRRLEKEGAHVTVNVLHPGTVMTDLGAHLYGGSIAFLIKVFHKLNLAKAPKQGAAPSCYLALHPGAKGVTGKYYMDDVDESTSPSEYVKDEELARKLWEFSVKLTSP